MTGKPRQQRLPGFESFESEPLSPSTLRDEPDWALVERITGKKCPENISLRNLSRMTQTELSNALGLTDGQTKKLGAALVLGERLANEGIERGMSVKSGEDVFRIFNGKTRDAKKEGFYAVTMDQKHQVIDLHQISEGTLTMCPVHPREAFNPIIRDSAAAVIFMHNHPSGNPEPSTDDWSLTQRLAESGKLLGIRVLDHVVVGDGAFVSLRDRGFDFERGGGSSRAAEAEYAGRAREPLGQSGKETNLSPPERQKNEDKMEKIEKEGRGPDADPAVGDLPSARLTFSLGSGQLKHTEVTLTVYDWNRMVENSARGQTQHLLNEQLNGITVLEESYENSQRGRLEALRFRDALNLAIPEREERAPFKVIDHEHFEQAFPEMVRRPPLPSHGNDPQKPSRAGETGKGPTNEKTRTFLVAPRKESAESPAPDYTGLVVIGKTPHKIDLWKDGRIQIARADPDRYTSVGSGRLVAGGPGSLSGPVQIQTPGNNRTSVNLGIQGLGKGTPIHLSVSEVRSEKILQKTQKPERGLER